LYLAFFSFLSSSSSTGFSVFFLSSSGSEDFSPFAADPSSFFGGSLSLLSSTLGSSPFLGSSSCFGSS